MALLQPGSASVSVGPITTDGYAHAQGIPMGVMLGSNEHPAAGVMPIRVVYAATQGFSDICTWAASDDHVWDCGPIAVRVCDDVYGCLGSGSLPLAMLETKGRAMTGTMTMWVTCTANSNPGVGCA